ncbi:MAG: transketolase, partial [Actinomycetota bacterium]|nr:transketolase [Actinomycetota bacterium]
MTRAIDQLAADTIRTLSMDAIQRANSGHPGMPLGMADIAVVLWSKYLKVDPADPTWRDRDRFILSNGHGSMLLYSLLHLSGFPLSMEDIKDFRQWGSHTPGHPEVDQERGIETTTGPLGQGIATSVGMAIAEEHLSAVYGPDLTDHRTYVFVGDGDLMEGISSEAASLAGHLQLGKLTVFYDDNSITIDGSTDLAFSEDVPARFEAYGWHTMTIDGHDRSSIAGAIEDAIGESNRPTLIACKTHIGFGAPTKVDSAAAHGSPLGPDEIAAAKAAIGWDTPEFEVPGDVYEFFSIAMQRGAIARAEWQTRVDVADRQKVKDWNAAWNPLPVALSAPPAEPGTLVATRSLSQKVINELGAQRSELMSVSGDLAPSTNSLFSGSSDFTATNRSGRNIRAGIREHAMGAIVNGLALHGGSGGFGATFLTFSDYMRPAVRLAALMEIPSVFVWTHDSIFLGEDGPTHQPIEHLAALRAIPGLYVYRPADPTETAVSWQEAVNRTDGPSAVVLTRQGLPVPETPPSTADVAMGGYVRRTGDDVVIVATGSEVSVAEGAASVLSESGVSVRVVSMPCVERFQEQSDVYRASVLGSDLPVYTLEAAATLGWDRFT